MIKAAEEGDVEYFRTSRLADAGCGIAGCRDDDTHGRARARRPLLETDQPLYEAPFVTLLTLAQNAAAAGAQAGIDTQWLTIVLGDLAARLKAGENQADLMEALLRLSVVPNTGTTAQAAHRLRGGQPVPGRRGQGRRRGGGDDDPQRRPRHHVEHPGRRDEPECPAGARELLGRA